MKTLELNQMEVIEGGDLDLGCAMSAISLAATFAGAFLVTGPVGAGIFAVGFISGSIGLRASCSQK